MCERVSYEEMLVGIKTFKPWRGPALGPGVPGFLHAPTLAIHVSGNNNGETRTETVDCLCGAKLDYAAFRVPSDQPAPAIWVGLQAFRKHFSDRIEAAERQLERMEISYHDRRANT